MSNDIVYMWGSYDNAVPGDSTIFPVVLSRLGTGSAASQGVCSMVNAENGWFSYLNATAAGVVPFGLGVNSFGQINRTGQNPIWPNPEQVGATSGTGTFPWTAAVGSGGPTKGPATLPFVQTDGGGEFSIHLDSAGNLYSCGTDNSGSLGVNTTTGTTITLPGKVYAVGNLTGSSTLVLKAAYGAISGGSDHWAGLQSAGTVVCCGSNAFGQCGDGSGVDPGNNYTVPVQVVKGAQAGTQYLGDTTAISYVSVGNKQSMALESGGMHVFTWGWNDQGQLGIGTNVDSSSPVNVTPFLVSAGATLPIVAISGGGGVVNGDGHCLAIDSVGKLFAWGDNRCGQIGTGTLATTSYNTPQLVTKTWSGTIVAASAGGDHSMALDSTGKLWTWGANGSGQLGRFISGNQPTPGQVTLLPGTLTIDLIFAGNQTSTIHGNQPSPPPVRFTNRRNLAGFFVASVTPLPASGEDLPTRHFTLPTNGLSTGGALSPPYTSNSGDWLLDSWARIATAYNGITPQLDIGSNIPTNTSGLFVTNGLAPIPLWVADVQAGGNTGIQIPGVAPGPRASLSYSSGLETLGPTPSAPVGRTQLFISAGGALLAIISQDGTAQTAVAAALTGNAIGTGGNLTTPIPVGSYNFVWTGTSLTLGGGGASPLTFSLTVSGSPISMHAALVTALNGATATGPITFSTLAVFSTDGTHLILTDNGNGNIAHIGAGGNGNTIGPGLTNDITQLIGLAPPSVLTGGAGGEPGSSAGVAVLNFIPVTPT